MIQKMIGVMLMLLSQYAAAMDMTIKGTTVYMSGTVVGGECDLLKKMIETSARLRAWIPRFAPEVDVELMNRWTALFYNKQMMYFL